MIKNRINVLKQIEQGELSAEEAEKILKKFDAKSQRFFCDSCLYSQDDLDVEEENLFLN